MQILGETIPSSEQPLNSFPSIVKTANELYDVWGPGYSIPVKVHRIDPVLEHNNVDSEVYASIFRMFGGPESNIYRYEWNKFVVQCLQS